MKYISFYISFVLLLSLSFFSGCKQKNNQNENKDDRIVNNNDSIALIKNNKASSADSIELTSPRALMEFLNAHRTDPPLATSWFETATGVEVSLILNNEKNIARFKEEVIDHPAIHFSKYESNMQLPLPDCDNCGIELSLSPNIFTDSISKPAMTMTNNSPYDVVTGFRQTVFKFANKQWELIPFNIVTNDLGILVPTGKSYQFDKIELYPYAYDYLPGRYLITKEVTLQKDEKTTVRYVVGAEFTVK